MEQIQVASSPAGRTKKLQDRLDRFPFDGLRVCARRCLLGVIRVESRSRATLGTVYTRVSVPASLFPSIQMARRGPARSISLLSCMSWSREERKKRTRRTKNKTNMRVQSSLCSAVHNAGVGTGMALYKVGRQTPDISYSFLRATEKFRRWIQMPVAQ